MEKFGLRATVLQVRGAWPTREIHMPCGLPARAATLPSTRSDRCAWFPSTMMTNSTSGWLAWSDRKKQKLFREDVDFCSPLVNLYTDSQSKALAVAQPRRVVLVAASPCRKTRSWCMAKSNEAHCCNGAAAAQLLVLCMLLGPLEWAYFCTFVGLLLHIPTLQLCMAKSNEAPRSFATSRRTSPSSLKSAAWRIWWRSTVTWLASTQWYWSIFWADLNLFSKLVLGTFKGSSLPNHHHMKSLNFMLAFHGFSALICSCFQ